MVDAQFAITYPRKTLKGAVISELRVSEEDCQYSCMEDDQCKSININDDGTECELNNGIVGDTGTNLIAKDGWRYKTSNFSAKQVNASQDSYTLATIFGEKSLISKSLTNSLTLLGFLSLSFAPPPPPPPVEKHVAIICFKRNFT